jgi:predicted RNase H-like HicB family nuclease
MHLTVVLEDGEDGFIIASCPTFPGCHSQGKTEEEALRNIREAISACFLALNDQARKQAQRNSWIVEVFL